MSSNESIMNNFRTKILKEELIPCMKNDINDIIVNRKTWERTQITYEYLRDILLVGSMISCFFHSRVATGVLIAVTGALIKLVSSTQNKQLELTERLNSYLKQIGINNLIPEIGDNNEEKHDSDKTLDIKELADIVKSNL